MFPQDFWTPFRMTGLFLVLSFIAMGVGVASFVSRNGIEGGPPPTYERAAIMASVVLTALGYVLLDSHLQSTAGHAWARLGLAVFFFAGPVLLVAEGFTLTQGEKSVYALIVSYVVLAFLAQAFIGAALLQSQVLPSWTGWLTVIWNLSWLVILPFLTPGDIYYPVLHNLIPLIIGIQMLWLGLPLE